MYPAQNKNLEYLFNLERFGIKPSLDNIRALCEKLGHPERSFKVIHITGTNGKGTTAAVIHSVLVESGYRAGLYTSPHMVKFGERIRINHKIMSDEQAGEMIEELKPLIEEVGATFFECATIMAFLHFAREKVDFTVVEVGMGGTWDATNIIPPPLICIFTPIALDHTARLGKDVATIAQDKAGIIKKGSVVITAPQDPEVEAVLLTKTYGNENIWLKASEEINVIGFEPHYDSSIINIKCQSHPSLSGEYNFPFPGRHQVANLRTALTAISVMQTLGINLPAEAVKLAVAKTSWPGRLQVLQQSPLVYYDVGHNPSAAKAVSEFFQGLFPARKIRILMGLVQDKDAEGFIDNIATIASDFTFTDLPTPRSRNPRDLERIAKSKPLPTRVIQNPREALEKIIAETAREDIILVIGSHYLGEPILSLYKNFRKKS